MSKRASKRGIKWAKPNVQCVKAQNSSKQGHEKTGKELGRCSNAKAAVINRRANCWRRTKSDKMAIKLSEQLFGKAPERECKILPLIEEMMILSANKEYETAAKNLAQIESILKEPTSVLSVPIGDIQTIKDVYDLVTGHAIRLNPKAYETKKNAFLELLLSLYRRRSELQGATYADTERHRKVVAEEMAANQITIPTSYRGRKPNRRFLETAFKVNPSLCKNELMRREKVKMWNAVGSGHEEEKDSGRKTIAELKNSDMEN